MRLPVALALSISVILIGFASWVRADRKPSISPQVVMQVSEDVSKADVEEFLKPKTASSTAPIKPLNTTDLVGRGLISDYFALAANGGVSEGEIANLANQYIEKFPTLTEVEKVAITQLKVVSNSQLSYKKYADEILTLHNNYAAIIKSAYLRPKQGTSSEDELYLMVGKFNEAYEEAARGLKVMSVPAALAAFHLELTNIYLESSAATEAIIKRDGDDAAAFAGLIAFNSNLAEEELVLNKISKFLTENGI